MAWWWSILLFLAGAFVGAVLMGVIAYDNVKRSKERWNDDE